MNKIFATVIAALFFAAAIGALTATPAAADDRPVITVYKSPACGCCGAWVEHLRKNGFDARVHEVPDATLYRAKYGVPEALGSCHTAVVGGYAIEGHVPAADIKRLLRDRPKAKGIAVPGMPIGSPGMPGPRKDRYETLLFDASGTYVVFERH